MHGCSIAGKWSQVAHLSGAIALSRGLDLRPIFTMNGPSTTTGS